MRVGTLKRKWDFRSEAEKDVNGNQNARDVGKPFVNQRFVLKPNTRSAGRRKETIWSRRYHRKLQEL